MSVGNQGDLNRDADEEEESASDTEEQILESPSAGEEGDTDEEEEGEEELEDDDDDEEEEEQRRVRVGDGELDLSVYSLFRTLTLPWPCLTLDAFSAFDSPTPQTVSPFDLTFVAGSQALTQKGTLLID